MANQDIVDGHQIVNLAYGHFDSPLPTRLKSSVQETWLSWPVAPLPPGGDPQLKDAVVDWLELRHTRTQDSVLISAGSRAAFSTVLSVIAGPGDAVLIDAGAWSIFRHPVTLTGATPVPLVSNDHYCRLDTASVARVLQSMPGAKAIVIANPLNTTGQLYDEKTLNEVLELCARHKVFLILDQLYGKLLFDGRTLPKLAAGTALRDWSIVVDGPVRAFRGLGGSGVGWACGPVDVIAAATILAEQNVGPVDRMAQRLAWAAIREPYVPELAEALQEARDMVMPALREIAGVNPWPVEATMFAVLDVQEYMGEVTPEGWYISSDVDFADMLLHEVGVLVLPGELIGKPGTVRISFSGGDGAVLEGISRINQAFRMVKAA
jgi:aspartate aminotransferase